MIAAFAVDRAARIVHHHPGASAGQQQRMRAAQPVAGAGDDGDTIVEADCHSPCSPEVLSLITPVAAAFDVDTYVCSQHACFNPAGSAVLGSALGAFPLVGFRGI
jgi:hypothetical protein